MSSTRYICCRCDAKSADALGAHVCDPPDDETLNALIVQKTGARTYIDERCIHGAGFFAWRFDDLERDISRVALSRGYRWTLSQVGDGTECRATFYCNIDTLASTALDRTPGRAFARAWLRLPLAE